MVFDPADQLRRPRLDETSANGLHADARHPSRPSRRPRAVSGSLRLARWPLGDVDGAGRRCPRRCDVCRTQHLFMAYPRARAAGRRTRCAPIHYPARLRARLVFPLTSRQRNCRASVQRCHFCTVRKLAAAPTYSCHAFSSGSQAISDFTTSITFCRASQITVCRRVTRTACPCGPVQGIDAWRGFARTLFRIVGRGARPHSISDLTKCLPIPTAGASTVLCFDGPGGARTRAQGAAKPSDPVSSP